MRLLVTGSAGMLGQDLIAAAEAAGHTTTGWDLPEIDITDAASVLAGVRELEPDAIVNCAAWTDVDGAEANEEQATAINAGGAANLAAAAAGAGALTVQLSTDYVFDGGSPEPYTESARTSPQSAYGRSKLAGEQAVAETAPGAHAIVRSAWLFGAHGKNFVATMLRLAAERPEVTVVDDQVGCPTYTGHLADALVEICERRLTGVLHVAGGGSCSWWELARTAFDRAGVECEVHRGRSEDLDRPAPRPAFSVLVSERDDAPRLPSWTEGLDAYLAATRVVAS
jgi:dTDP-4-dehydrorhamnose reductase